MMRRTGPVCSEVRSSGVKLLNQQHSDPKAFCDVTKGTPGKLMLLPSVWPLIAKNCDKSLKRDHGVGGRDRVTGGFFFKSKSEKKKKEPWATSEPVAPPLFCPGGFFLLLKRSRFVPSPTPWDVPN